VVLDLEKNTASAVIWPKGSNPEYTQIFKPVALNFPGGSIFNSDSKLFLCYDGQQSTQCAIEYLEIIFDARGGDAGALGILYGKQRCFISVLIKII